MKILILIALLFTMGAFAQEDLNDYGLEEGTVEYQEQTDDGKVYDDNDEIYEEPAVVDEQPVEEVRDYNQEAYDDNQQEPEYLGDYDDVNDREHPPYPTDE